MTSHAGQVTLDKSPTLRTVVNKTNEIDNTFRFFKMEVLAGEEDFLTTVRENDCTFTFDYSTVYWNSHLISEHERVVELLSGSDVVLDVFAGVGPFAVPAAKKKRCTVYANDLNPHSYRYLVENVRTNGVRGLVHPYNLDGREFLVSVTQKLLEGCGGGGLSMLSGTKTTPASKGGGSVGYSHVIMNLPGSATQFLDTFRGLFRSVPELSRPHVTLPWVHCYCFVKADPADEPAQERAALELVKAGLGPGVRELRRDSYSVKQVRHVAPWKFTMRVSFRLPEEVAYAKPEEREEREKREVEGRTGEGEETEGEEGREAESKMGEGEEGEEGRELEESRAEEREGERERASEATVTSCRGDASMEGEETDNSECVSGYHCCVIMSVFR